tara:strand:- start:6100 stop:7380 length:1281 start_codon:yes stop_codon:yes gene_type:complete
VNKYKPLSILHGSRFVRDVTTVATGILAAQAIVLVFSPFLTRIFGPEAFGILAAFTAVTTIMNAIVTLGYATAIVLPSDDQDAISIARLSLVCALGLTPLTLFVVWMFQLPLSIWANLQDAPGVLYMLPLVVLLNALLNVAEQAAIRESFFKASAISKLIATFVTNSCKLAAGLVFPTAPVLIGVTVAGIAVNYAMLLYRAPREGSFQVRQWFKTGGVSAVAREYMDFPLYRMPQSLINALALGLPVLILTAQFGAVVAGQYALTTLALGAPVMLLSKSVLDVFYPRISREIIHDRRNASILLMRATKVSALLALVVFVPVGLTSQYIFPFVFGDEWVLAGLFAKWVCIWMASTVASRPAVASIPGLGLQKQLLTFEVVITFARGLSLFIGAIYWDPLTAVAAFSIMNAIGYTYLIYLAYCRMKIK